jgi:hypothetical protein
VTWTFVPDVAFSVRDSRLMAIMVPGVVTMIDRASARSLATFLDGKHKPGRSIHVPYIQNVG